MCKILKLFISVGLFVCRSLNYFPVFANEDQQTAMHGTYLFGRLHMGLPIYIDQPTWPQVSNRFADLFVAGFGRHRVLPRPPRRHDLFTRIVSRWPYYTYLHWLVDDGIYQGVGEWTRRFGVVAHCLIESYGAECTKKSKWRRFGRRIYYHIQHPTFVCNVPNHNHNCRIKSCKWKWNNWNKRFNPTNIP